MDGQTRRGFLRAGAAGTAAAGGAAGAQGRTGEECGSVWQRPPKQQGNNLNLVLLVSDTFRADNLACYGSKWVECPELNRLAEESVIFEDAYPEGMPTIPIRRTLMTGRRILPFYYHRQHEPVQLPGWHELYNEDVTLSETLREAGYLCALHADIPHMQRPGKNFHRGYHHYEWVRGHEADSYATAPRKMQDFSALYPAAYMELPEIRESLPRFLNQYIANRERWRQLGESLVELTAKNAMAWLRQNHQQAPFFLHVEAFDPHEPWDPPRSFLEKYLRDPSGHEWPEPPYADVTVPPEGVKRMRANYAGEASSVDYWFGRILETLRDLKLTDNTLIMFLADHGALLGEQGQFLKGPARLRTQVTHIPLLVRLPRREMAGRRVKGFVQIPDLMPTLLGRLGLKPPSRCTGADIWPLATGQTHSLKEYVVQAYGWIAAVRTPEWNYTRAWRPAKLPQPFAPQLYDCRRDPEELVNVAEKYPEEAKKLSAMLDEYMASGEALTRGSFHERAA